MAQEPVPRRGGRPNRGDRKTVILKIQPEHYFHYWNRAHLKWLALSDYLCATLAEAHGLAVPGYIQPQLHTAEGSSYPPPPASKASYKGATIRIPVDHYTYYVRMAQDQGTTVSNYLRTKLAELHQLDGGYAPVHLFDEARLIA